jgi:TRAP-type C4-dicarboxylate transport system substrate-binding protein
VHLFLRTANAFASEIERSTEGALKIEVLTVSDYNAKYGKSDDLNNIKNIFQSMEDGTIEMSQTTVGHYGIINKNFLALDLPFLFKDHDHATRVFEGPVGQGLCNSLAETSGLKGLAFTYSGGWRIIGSNDAITNLEELKGKRIRTNGNPVTYITMDAIGAIPATPSEVGYTPGYDLIDSGDLDASESTYLRFKGKNILKTGHSLFLTTISVSKKFWNSLDARTQELMQEAAVAAAKLERQWSIEDAEQFEQNCAADGVKIHELSQADLDELVALTMPVYNDVEGWFAPGLIESIKKQ